jgi:hypothetical protein
MASPSSEDQASTGGDYEEVQDVDEASEINHFTYTITSYGADYPVDSLVKRMDGGDIIVPKFDWDEEKESEVVGFQREYVWPKKKADRFIESLLLGLPVPGIFLVKEPSGRLLVLDGHQRLYSLKSFYKGVLHGKEYRLEGVQEKFGGKRYEDLDTEDRRRIDDSIIHATVIRQDEPTDDQSSIYLIFERLNTGGVNLQPQEIRIALFHGELVNQLHQLNTNKNWRDLYGKKSPRLKDIEMILRFFAFYYNGDSYKKPMKEFLNGYMGANRELKNQSAKDLKELFEGTVKVICEGIGRKAFRPVRAVNAAVLDSVMTGVARRLAKGRITDFDELKKSYEALMQDSNYRDSVNTSTSQETNVTARMAEAVKAFEGVK